MKQKNSLAGKLTTTADFTDIFAILFWVIPCRYVVIFLSDFTLSDFIFLFFFFFLVSGLLFFQKNQTGYLEYQ